ncbi:MAG TPA: PepSY-like domain-containing protein [Mucilaginibacter sp.]|nr:PepSY-like domain-containing protein [Mucilaginibacter sp.]
MKSLQLNVFILVAATGVMTTSAMAQTKDHNIPKVVITNFSAQYPHADLQKWQAKNDQYMASFKWDKHQYEAWYSPEGQWKKTDMDVKWSWDLPPAVRSSFKKSDYSSWKIDDMEKVETPFKDTYNVRVDNGNMLDDKHYAFRSNRLLSFDLKGDLRSVNRVQVN